jgi:hypothetical protein
MGNHAFDLTREMGDGMLLLDYSCAERPDEKCSEKNGHEISLEKRCKRTNSLHISIEPFNKHKLHQPA